MMGVNQVGVHVSIGGAVDNTLDAVDLVAAVQLVHAVALDRDGMILLTIGK